MYEVRGYVLGGPIFKSYCGPRRPTTKPAAAACMKPRSGRSLWRDSAYGALYGHLPTNSGREIGPVLSAVSACAAAAVRLLTPTGWTGSGFHAPLACQIFLLGELAMREKVIFRCGLLQPSPGGAASGRSRCSPSDGHIFAPRSPPEPSDGAPESSECALDAPYLQRRRALRTKELKRTHCRRW